MQQYIGLLNESYPPINDGVVTVTRHYAEGLTDRGEKVCVMTPHVKGGQYDAYPYKVLDYLSIPIPGRKPYVAGLPWIDAGFWRRVNRIPFKLLHVNSPFVSASIAEKIVRRQGIPMVGAFHSKFRDDFEKEIPVKAVVDVVMKRMVAFYERCNEVWVPAESVVEVLREYGYKGPVEVVQNGTDLAGTYPDTFFAEARRELGLAPGEFVMLYVGQHVWQKNLRLMLDALGLLKDLPYRMFFIGAGYAESEMHRLAAEKGIGDKVTFVGSVWDRTLLTKYYAAADLFLFPSLYDTDGIVKREAASLRTPSLMVAGSTAAAAAKDRVDAFLCENTPESFAAAIRAVSADPELLRRVGETASVSLARGWDAVVDEVTDRYNALIRRA